MQIYLLFIISSLDLQGTAEDFLLAGTDTTAITTTMALYHIARHPEVQQTMLDEIQAVLNNEQEPTTDILNSTCLVSGIDIDDQSGYMIVYINSRSNSVYKGSAEGNVAVESDFNWIRETIGKGHDYSRVYHS